MSLKHRLYSRLKQLVATPYGVLLMVLLSFFESCLSPITPVVMLIPMVLMHKEHALKYVNLATLGAVLGSILGYFIGVFLMGYVDSPAQARGSYGFSPSVCPAF